MSSLKISTALLTVSDVARLLGVSTSSIRYYERSGKLIAIKVHTGERLFSRFEVERFAIERNAKLSAKKKHRSKKGEDL